jgi:hypothetical protein
MAFLYQTGIQRVTMKIYSRPTYNPKHPFDYFTVINGYTYITSPIWGRGTGFKPSSLWILHEDYSLYYRDEVFRWKDEEIFTDTVLKAAKNVLVFPSRGEYRVF